MRSGGWQGRRRLVGAPRALVASTGRPARGLEAEKRYSAAPGSSVSVAYHKGRRTSGRPLVVARPGAPRRDAPEPCACSSRGSATHVQMPQNGEIAASFKRSVGEFWPKRQGVSPPQISQFLREKIPQISDGVTQRANGQWRRGRERVRAACTCSLSLTSGGPSKEGPPPQCEAGMGCNSPLSSESRCQKPRAEGASCSPRTANGPA